MNPEGRFYYIGFLDCDTRTEWPKNHGVQFV